MRRRPPADDPVSDVTRRRLAALRHELGGEPERTPDPPPDPSPVPAAGRHAGPARTPLGSAQVAVVAVVVGVGLLLSGWWALRASGSPEPVAPPLPVLTPGDTTDGTHGTDGTDGADGSAATTGAGSGPVRPAERDAGAGAAATTGSIVVDVVGKVRRPGIAVLPEGARVVDAVDAAGGVLRGFDSSAVNMARVLSDGEQVVIARHPVQPAGSPPPGDATDTPLVNVNTADQRTLETLPGIGPVTAAAILQWRSDHGTFTAVEELMEVSGIGDAILTLSPVWCQA
jgi:competence protein ComEA